MMSKLRSLIVWSVVFTQLWTPVLAQTLPITVDKSVPGQRPTVGVSNGVPVINIAPPSAGGVSNNRYTQFNVGPSGVVLNNSGGASQTQLAGQVAGNVMLGNQRAATILNQVTAPNPSQLMGALEVAGNRANVIVANPAGITCNGCGFLNADRATLTTGRPQVGPDGSVGFDVATGRLSIQGEGLYGANLSQVDLIARSLEVNAGIWANQLNVVTGPNRVDYASGQVSAGGAEGPAPAVALDTAALGGMYANSIRLIGTEAGVGVNVGGNLASLTGSLQVSVNGDVTVQPSGRLQAATDLSLDSKGGVANAGTVTAGGALAVRADGGVANSGNLSATSDIGLIARDLSNSGNLTSLSGGLQVSVNGDARNLASGRLQAATNLAVDSKGAIVNAGTVAAGTGLFLRADGSIANSGGMSAAADIGVIGRDLSNSGNLTAGLRPDGSISPLGNLQVQVGAFQNSGTLVAGGDASVTAGALNLSGGKFVAGANLVLDVSGTLSNRGGAVYGGSVALLAGGLDNTSGKITSGGALSGNVAGAIDNTGGTLAAAQAVDLRAQSFGNTAGGVVSGDSVALHAAAGINNQGGTLQANGRLAVSSAGALNNQDGKLLGGAADIQAGSLNNRNGVIQADGALAVASAGLLGNQSGGIYGGSVDLKTASAINTGGNVVSGGALDWTAGGHVDNAGGTVAAQGLATLNAQSLSNSGGIVAGRGVTLTTLGVLNNNAGLIQADEALTVTASSVSNRDTLDQTVAAGAQGLMGKQVLVTAGAVDNQAGRIGAGQDLNIATGTLSNLGGNVSSNANADISTDRLLNDAGALTAGASLALTTGDLANAGQIHSGGDLTLNAASLTNRESGEIIAVGNNLLNVAGTLSNAGLIDGGYTRIEAGDVRNTGRIYGDRVGIKTPTLLNDANAVIASRGDMDLGIGTLTNQENALIFAAGDLRLGGGLDAAGRAQGMAQSLVNKSATIEVAGNADIAAGLIENLNNHFASETAEVKREAKWYYRLDGTTEIVDGEGMWFCNTVKSICGRDPSWMGEFDERRLLMPSAQYPESQYGPPFDYSNIQGDQEGRAGVSAPIGLAYTAEFHGCNGGEAGDCYTNPPQFHYDRDAKIWSVFEVERPSGVRKPPLPEDCGRLCPDDLAQQQASYDHDLELYEALNEKISAFNADFRNNRMIKDFTFYEVTEITQETRITQSDPGKIIVGGNARLTGNVVNDKSRILAGGTLKIEGGTLSNVGAEGLRSVEHVGIMAYTFEKNDSRKYNRSDYNATVVAERIETGLGAAQGNTATTPENPKPGASTVVQALPPATVTRVSLPGNRIVAVVVLPPAIPTSALYRVMPAANAPYLIATDPQFLGQRPVLSSDYLLQQLNQDPTHILKRLGDGFYEQKLVAEQVMLATGQRFVGDYTDNESQYKALLSAGADFAGQYGLTVGTALSEEQMRHLTSDIVWLVEQTVTLPDGTQQKVLSPQVYLAVQPGDLRGDGTLIAGRDTHIATTGDVANSGTIGARNALVVEAENVRNTVGSMQGKSVNLAARNDIDNLAGLLKGDAVSLSAGRDINLLASTQSNVRGGISNTIIDGVARIDAGTLSAQAGRDFNAQAAAIATTDDARIQAGNNINLTTADTRYGESFSFGKKNRSEMRTTEELGTQIAAGGNLTLIAGQDVNARAAQVSSDQQLAVGAGRDINVLAGEASGYTYNEIYYKTKGFMSSKTTHRKRETDWTQAVGSTFTGDSAVLMSGRDLNLLGSNVAAQNDLVMSAERDVNITAGRNSFNDYQYEKVKKSGFGGMGGFSYGTSQKTDSLDGKKVFHSASTVGSVEGDVLINAGNALNITGSNVIARQGDITLIGKEVSIGAALDTLKEKEFHELKQTGLTLTASNPVVSAMQTGARMADAAGKTDNAVMKGLAGATAGLAAVNAYDAVQASTKAAAAAEAANPGSSNQIDKVGGISIKLSLGSSKSSSTTDRNSSSAFGSTVAAGKDLTIVAQGAGKDSDITVTGSNLSAGNNVVLKAEGDILLQAARNAFEQKTDSKSSSASIGIGYSTGGQQNGWSLELGASVGRGNANGRDESWTNSQVTAGNILAIQSGGDTTLKGAAGRAEQILASVGGNLLLESLQDSSKYDSKNKSAGFGVVLCIPPYCAGSSSVSANASTGKMNSDFKSVTEQTGLWAGDGGFLIDVKNNTTLIGSVIASSDKAVADGLNKLTTGTLVTEDIKNTARYSGSQVSVGGGFGFGGSKAGDSGLGTTKGGQVAGGATKDAGSSISTGSSGFGMGTPMVVAASGNASSTTQSGISGGTIVIRDEAGQLALTGKTAAETIASLNRDTSDTLNTLKPIFDKEKIEAGFEIASEAQRQMGQFLTNRAKEIQDAKTRSEDKSLSYADRAKAAQEYADLESKWGAQGTYSQWATVILGAASGNVTGGTSQFIQAAAVNYLQTLGAAKVKELSSVLGGEGSVGHAALHAVLGCAGAAAQGASCSAGGAGALSGVVLNKLLESMDGANGKDLSPEESQARVNLISSIVAGIAAAIDPAAAVPAELAARIETENNSQYRNRDKVARMKAELVGRLEAECGNNNSCLQAGWAEADRIAASYDEVLTLIHYPELTKEKADALAQAVLDLAPGVSNASALYELVTGKTATGDEANRFFAGIGLVPIVGGMLKKGGQAIHVFAEADKALDVGKVGGAKGDFWSSTKSKTPVENAYGHWDKHKSEFPEFQNSKQYVEGAKNFLNNPPPGSLIKTRPINGDIVIYDPASNVIGIKSADGTPRTMFKPEVAQHGYPTNLEYFYAQ
ncbi:Adenosine monophosphate-protein transferase and cysteine protease IbpA precursor [compost metagenome]